MRTQKEYLQALKDRLKAPSWYAVSKATGIHQQTFYQYVKGIRFMDDHACFVVADALNIQPAEVIAAVNLEREKDLKKKEYWETILKKFVSTAAALTLGAVVFIGIQPSESLASTTSDLTRYTLSHSQTTGQGLGNLSNPE